MSGDLTPAQVLERTAMELERIDQRLERMEVSQGERLGRIESELESIRQDQRACNVWRQDFEAAQARAAQAEREATAEHRGERRMLRRLYQLGLVPDEAMLQLERETDDPPPPRVVLPGPIAPGPLESHPPPEEKPKGREVVAEAIADTLQSAREGATFARVFGSLLLVVGGPTTAALFAQPVQLWLYRVFGLEAP